MLRVLCGLQADPSWSFELNLAAFRRLAPFLLCRNREKRAN
jgi:hypothetical protein